MYWSRIAGSAISWPFHREDLHAWSYQYAGKYLWRDEARRIAKAISRLPELLKRPNTFLPTSMALINLFSVDCARKLLYLQRSVVRTQIGGASL